MYLNRQGRYSSLVSQSDCAWRCPDLFSPFSSVGRVWTKLHSVAVPPPPGHATSDRGYPVARFIRRVVFGYHRTRSLLLHKLLNGLNLRQHRGAARATVRVPSLNTLLKVEYISNVSLEQGRDLLKVVEGKLGDGHASLLTPADDGTGDVVSLSERHTLADEVVSHIGGEHVVGEGSLHLFRVDLEGGKHALHDPQACGNGLDAVNHGLDRFLEILVVRGGKRLEGGKETGSLVWSHQHSSWDENQLEKPTCPITLPALPRMSSKLSGFFFWGIKLLPVL